MHQQYWLYNMMLYINKTKESIQTKELVLLKIIDQCYKHII